jgi:hypothetical protein
MLEFEVRVSTLETLDKLLTESISSLLVDLILDRPPMIACWNRIGQEYGLEV